MQTSNRPAVTLQLSKYHIGVKIKLLNSLENVTDSSKNNLVIAVKI